MNSDGPAGADKASTRPESPWGSAFDHSPVPMWVVDGETRRFLAVNDAALAQYGYGRAEFPALTWEKLQTSDSRDDVPRHRRADGSVFDARVDRSSWEIDGRTVSLIVATETSDQGARESEERFRQLFEAASDGFWETDTKGRMTYVSPSYEATFGSAAGEVLGKRIQEFQGVDIPPEMAEKAIAAMKQRAPFRDFVYSRLALTTGKKRWVHTNCVPMFDRAAGFIGYRGVARDISVQVEAELALRSSEKRFREIYELASDFYWEFDATYRYTDCSPGWEAIHGMPFADAKGKRLVELPGMSMTPEMGKRALVAQHTKQPFRDVVYSKKLPSGDVRTISVCGMPTFDEAGQFRGYQGVGVDITARIEAELAAGLAQQRLHDAVNYVSQPFVVYDADDKVIAFNNAFIDLHRRADGKFAVWQGVSFAELAQWQVESGFYANGSDQATVEVLLSRHEVEGEHSYALKDGRWMLVGHRRLPGGGTVGLWTDISAVKHAEEEKRRLEDQLHHSQRLEGLGTLAGGAAHEINNALVPVIALTKLVARRLPTDSREHRNLSTVLAGAERSRDLVKQILAFSRKEEHRRESVDVAALLIDALQLMRATVPTSIRFEQDIAPVPPLLGDANELRQVIVNLVTNAAQAIGEKHGRITVGLRAEGSDARLWIADTGCGMDDATRLKIFEPFFTTKEVGKGTGLGLAVVHGIIESHGGRIEVTSKPGHGTRFDIVLPARPQRADADAAA
jgi:PAS domain S-box-containing protein